MQPRSKAPRTMASRSLQAARALVQPLPLAQPTIFGEDSPSAKALIEGHVVSGWLDSLESNALIYQNEQECLEAGTLYDGPARGDFREYVATPDNPDLRAYIRKLERQAEKAEREAETEAQRAHEDELSLTQAARFPSDEERHDNDATDQQSEEEEEKKEDEEEEEEDEEDEEEEEEETRQPARNAGQGATPAGGNEPLKDAKPEKKELIELTFEMDQALRRHLLKARPLIRAGIENAESNDRSGPYALPPNKPVEGFRDVEFRLTAMQRDGVGRYKRNVELYGAALIADEMGLGKTAITVVHIQLEVNAARQRGDFPLYAVIVPKGLVSNWLKELNRSKTLRFCDFSTKRHMSVADLHTQYDVLVIPSGLLSGAYSNILEQYVYRHAVREGHKERLDNLLSRQPVPLTFEDRGHLDYVLFGCEFAEVIIDEAQSIKNGKTMLARAMRSMKAKARVAITGTPLQNVVKEFGAMLLFLNIEPFGDPATFTAAFTRKRTTGNLNPDTKQTAMHNDAILCAIRSAVTIRRNKVQLFDGESMMEIPDFKIEVCRVNLSPKNVLFQAKTRDLWDEEWLAKLEQQEQERIEDEREPESDEDILPQRDHSEVLIDILDARRNVIHEELVKADYDGLEGVDNEDGEPSAKRAKLNNKQKTALSKDMEKWTEHRRTFLAPFQADPDAWESDRTVAVVELIEKRLAHHAEEASKHPTVAAKNRHLATHKVLVFCEFLSALDLVELGLKSKGIKSMRYDGTIPPKRRDEVRRQFEEEGKDFECDDNVRPDDIKVLLITTKAGNEGINLVHACDVVLVSSHWNPAVEDQEIGRAFRKGQLGVVTVFRFYSHDSIERRMQKKQHTKRKDVARVLDDAYVLNFQKEIQFADEEQFLEMVGYKRCVAAVERGDLKV
ncbi:SNF2 family DNA-dependent ATPase domain-containing protein [Zymoseptoria tritici IPO323]|uniref:SNF2 family DNA-dependent ATPase domain-containing protein n=1 Tax=Zymoseptoria tritici (strain CBS 115943 / IPO323) TaxID=336722 RepID=F9X3C0_ZYMTI|nr:SNF2 family DNA-dependent ATPase domain-containing protein [Zymoseptoria tritici IPO323]EGP89724.1 SNF2 family DNA-dependent ATPase domain-containing protein [Zymoseptoria tritici IPO323]